jgi:hypothetical protein
MEVIIYKRNETSNFYLIVFIIYYIINFIFNNHLYNIYTEKIYINIIYMENDKFDRETIDKYLLIAKKKSKYTYSLLEYTISEYATKRRK